MEVPTKNKSWKCKEEKEEEKETAKEKKLRWIRKAMIRMSLNTSKAGIKDKKMDK